jgi:membrane protein implicated in regulation of membrane protease activity
VDFSASGWWAWLIVGLVLLALEAIVPSGFFLLLFGIGALATGGLAALGVVATLPLQLLLWCVSSIVLTVALRGTLRSRFGRTADRTADSLVGEVATALAELPAHAIGRVELRGSSWNARNVGVRAIDRGQRCLVERVDGLTLWVREET